jgi:hypothetical protein
MWLRSAVVVHTEKTVVPLLPPVRRFAIAMPVPSSKINIDFNFRLTSLLGFTVVW